LGAVTSRPEAGGAYRWYCVILLAVIAVISYTDRYILNVLVEPLRKDMGLTDTQISLLQGAAFAVIYSIAGLPFGRLADRFNRRNLILFGIVLWSVATILCAFTHSFAEMFASRIAVGVGEASLAPAAVSLLSDLFPPSRRAGPLGTFITGTRLGSGMAIVLGGILLALVSSGSAAGRALSLGSSPWRSVIILVSLPCFVLAALMWATVREPSRSGGASAKTRPQSALAYFGAHRAGLAPLYFGVAALAVVDCALSAWMPTMLIRRFAFTAAEVGLVYGPIAVTAGCLGAAMAGAVGSRLTRQGHAAGIVTGAAGAISICVLLSAFALIPNSTLVLAVFGVFEFFAACTGVSVLIAINDAVPGSLRGLATSGVAFLSAIIGLGAGPSLVALVTQYVLHDPTALNVSIPCITVPFSLLSALLLWTARRRYAATAAAALAADRAVPTEEELREAVAYTG
jgi:MFS family permease